MKRSCKTNEGTLDTDVEARLTIVERILLWLLRHPYQRLEDIALAIRIHPSSVCRHLAHPVQQHQVESVTPTLGQTSKRSFYYLTQRGVGVLADLLGESPESLIRTWQIDEKRLLRLLPRFHALIPVQNLINSLVAHAPAALADPGDGKPLIRWHWVRSYQQTFVSKGRRYSCQSDAALVLAYSHPSATLPHQEKAEEHYYSALILADPGLIGNDDQRLIQTRLEGLLRWRESLQWGQHYSQFPPLLVLTSDGRGREMWQWCAREAASRLHLAPLKGAIVVYANEASWPEAWYLSWQQISAARPCLLRDLFTPTLLGAVPAGLLASRPTLCRGASQRQEGPTSKLIKGCFTQRAEKSVYTLLEHKSDKREAVALLGLQAHRRHLEILLQIYAHPLLSKEELAIFLNMQTTTLIRYLYDLKQMACVQRQETICGERLLLSQRGLCLIASVLNVSLQHLCEISRGEKRQVIQRGVTYALRTIKHTSGIYQFLAQLQQTAHVHDHELTWWETGARCARRYHSQGRWHNLLPDASFEYRAREQTIRAWLEWDEGTMNRRDLEAKMRAYARFVRARQWVKDGSRLSMLVIVVPEKGQEMRMQQVVMDVLGETELLVRSTTATRLEEHGPLGGIWLLINPQSSCDQLVGRKRWLDMSILEKEWL